MKKIIEGIKDFLYDSIDYIIMIGIVGIVAIIIGWRLDLLFAKEAAKLPPKDNIIVENPRTDTRDDDIVSNEDDNNSDIENSDENIDENTNENLDENSNDNNPIIDEGTEENIPESTVVKIVIPAGSLPSRIGSILEENNLISSRAEFVQKSQELKLDTKLKSGTFEINSNSSLEEIIRIIAK